MEQEFKNPFRPGAGQLPPYLAGRNDEIEYFEKRTLTQSPVNENLIISGLRGVGKTVLLETLRPYATKQGWLWAGTDLSESSSVSERTLATRIITDLAGCVSTIPLSKQGTKVLGYKPNLDTVTYNLSHGYLEEIYNSTPGLASDKLKRLLEMVWDEINHVATGIILAYDEAQILQDKADEKQYPLSVLLEVVQYLQRKDIPYLLVLTGLPTLFSNLIEARTYAERMFHQMILTKLSQDESEKAITIPIEKDNCPVKLGEQGINDIINYSGGYPYFIQYMCKESYDSYLQQKAVGVVMPIVRLNDIIRKLDTDFYQGRWNRVTDRQRELVIIIANLPNAEEEFTLAEIEKGSLGLDLPFSKPQISVMLKSLIKAGLIYKNRRGRYSFAVPMFSYFIKRELAA